MFLGRKNSLDPPMYAVPPIQGALRGHVLHGKEHCCLWDSAAPVCMAPLPGAVTVLTCVQHAFSAHSCTHTHPHCINLGTPGYCGILYMLQIHSSEELCKGYSK